MRSELVDNYFVDIMNESRKNPQEKGSIIDVYEELYRQIMDNRIFNNLK